jgi:magnesium transporter
MIRVINLDDNKEERVSQKDLEKLTQKKFWIEVTNPSDNDLAVVSKKTEIPKRFLEFPEARRNIKLRIEPDFTVINFVILQSATNMKEVNPIIIVFTKTFLVTVTKKEDQELVESTRERMSKAKADPPSLVAYFLIDEIVSTHFVHLEKLEQLTSKLEEEVVEKTKPDTLRRIFELKSNLVNFNKTLWYERGLIFNIGKCKECLTEDVQTMFDTTHEDLTRQIDIVETYREIMSDAIDVHLSSTSNRINLSVKSLTVVIFYLTIVTTITVFPNTVATFFGISQFGTTNYMIILVALLVSIILPVFWLWRKKWLRPE